MLFSSYKKKNVLFACHRLYVLVMCIGDFVSSAKDHGGSIQRLGIL